MPITKNAYRRYHLIDELLQRKRKPSLEDILDYLEGQGCPISGPTLEKDLAAMRSHFNCSIAYDRPKNYYYYEDMKECFDTPISNEDVETIWMAIGKLKQFQYSQAFKNVNISLERIMSRLEIDLDKKQQNADKIIYYEPEPDFAGSEWLSVIYDAIRDEKIISFSFEDLSEPTEHLLEPYVLKEFAGRWYVIGLENGETATYGLDRIAGLVLTESYYQKNADTAKRIKFNLERNLGMLDFSSRRHEVLVRFDASLADEIKRNPFLKNQRITHENPKEIIISLRPVVMNEAFVQKVILPYAGKAVVYSPPFAIDLVARILTRMLDPYNEILSHLHEEQERIRIKQNNEEVLPGIDKD